MVGPSTAELDSVNELIRFDHVYVKSKAQTNPMKNPLKPKQMVSVLRPIQSKESRTVSTTINSTTTVPSVLSPTVKKEEVVSKSTKSEAPLNLNLGDMDLEVLSDSLEGVVDFDTMFQDLFQMQDEIEKNTTETTTTTPLDFSINSTSNKRKALDDVADLPVKKTKSDDVKINLSVKATFQPVLTTPDPVESGYMFDFEKDSLSSSGYLSDDACSPKSDDSGLIDTFLPWEEQSFNELFPSLMQ